MEKAKKALLMNLSIFSLILSIVYGIIITHSYNIRASETSYISGPGDAVMFVLFFLIMYMGHIVLSVLHYLIFKNVAWKLLTKMIIFNVVVAALIMALYFYLHDPIVLILVFTPIVFSFSSGMKLFTS